MAKHNQEVHVARSFNCTKCDMVYSGIHLTSLLLVCYLLEFVHHRFMSQGILIYIYLLFFAVI